MKKNGLETELKMNESFGTLLDIWSYIWSYVVFISLTVIPKVFILT